MKKFFSFLLFIAALLMGTSGAYAQSAGTQNVRGTIIDKQSETPLVGVAVELIGSQPLRGSVTDVDGHFTIEDVPVGRQAFRVRYIGYNSIEVPNVVVTTGKEVLLDIALEESVTQIKEVVITAETQKDKPNNELATISSRAFTMEEVNRYSGGRNDVSRLVSNFAGVSASDDSRNDIVIRGNSPTGVLWRLEGVPIPNPNHFATLGTTGGPVSAINPNMLKNSDFLTSAFPAEYGNALSGVFDLGFRNGNRDKYEFSAQLAVFSGLEVTAEGPLNKSKDGSFLIAYRHSFAEIASSLGINVGTTATPKYKDLSFNIDFGNTKAGKFTLFGIGGLSNIAFIGKDIDTTDLFANPDQDSYADSKIGVVGLKHNILLSPNTYIRTILSASVTDMLYDAYNYPGDGTRLKIIGAKDLATRYTVSSFVNHKFNARMTLRGGILADYQQIDTKVIDREDTPDHNGDGVSDWETRRDFTGGMTLIQPFVQSQYKLSEQLVLNAGLHGQVLTYNNSFAVEPRVALNWTFRPNHTLNIGYGLHNQMQPLPVFFYREEVSPGVFVETNKDLGFTRSNQFVLGYDAKFAKNWRSKLEVYYQAIDGAPVEKQSSTFSLLNAGADFIFPEKGSLVNKGKGSNYGLEWTLEKFFSEGYYGLLTASLFESKYKGSDQVERNTAFNNRYVLNVLAGKEFKFGKDSRNAFTFDVKMTTAGGRYYTPVDLQASMQAGREIRQESLAYSERNEPYFRLDAKVGIRLNSKKHKFSQQFYIDFQNLTNHKNVFSKRYNKLTNEVNTVYQSGFQPDLMFRVQF